MLFSFINPANPVYTYITSKMQFLYKLSLNWKLEAVGRIIFLVFIWFLIICQKCLHYFQTSLAAIYKNIIICHQIIIYAHKNIKIQICLHAHLQQAGGSSSKKCQIKILTFNDIEIWKQPALFQWIDTKA